MAPYDGGERAMMSSAGQSEWRRAPRRSAAGMRSPTCLQVTAPPEDGRVSTRDPAAADRDQRDRPCRRQRPASRRRVRRCDSRGHVAVRRMPELDERAATQHRRHHETRDGCQYTRKPDWAGLSIPARFVRRIPRSTPANASEIAATMAAAGTRTVARLVASRRHLGSRSGK